MIISRGRRYIFVHIPKTGGTSLALALEARAMKDDILIGDTPKAVKRQHRVQDLEAAGRLWKHSTLADIEGVVSREEMAEMFVFTLVRNPWDRMVSYYHWLQEQSFDHVAVRLAQALDFDGFLQRAEIQESFRRSPVASYLRDGAGVDRGNLYIRLEHFEEDAQPLFRHLGFSVELPHENASDREADYRAYYSHAAREVVAECCAEDIARLGYRF
jgi:hypothetical protein